MCSVAVDRALGRIDRRGRDHAGDVLELDAERGDLGRIDLHAHRGLLLAADDHLRDARNLRDLLRDDVLGVVVDLRQRQHVGVHREDQDRRSRPD